jgi:hypothetical protein
MASHPKRKPNARALAQFVPKALGEAFAKQGFVNGEIVLRWPEIAGPDLARRSQPVKLVWPRQAARKDEAPVRQPATLLIQVESAFALELQMQTPVLIERINRYFGWQCVGALKLKQGIVARRRPSAPAEPRVTPAQEQKIAALVTGVEDSRLADALIRLGREVSSASRR